MMTTDIAVVEQITPDKIKDYMNTFGIGNDLNDSQKQQFIEIATAYNLNPFKREIYCTKYLSNVKQPDGTWKKEEKLSIITGYESYLKRAERSGRLDGWKVEIADKGSDKVARITIHRKDWQNPLIHDVLFSEYNQDNKMWKEKPVTMLKKVAMAQGFRLAFPDELGGMPYAAEELPDNMTTEPAKIEQQQPEPEQPSVTPEVLKNAQGEIELQPGDQKVVLESITTKCKTEQHIQQFLAARGKRTWTTEELEAQDKAITDLRKSWNQEAAQ